MPTTILATKFYIPPPRPKTVLRARLIERLNDGLTAGAKLSLISAPAGFGKTTLVSEWVARCGRATAWLSLDEGDNDPIRFLTCLVTALQTIAGNIGAGVLMTLQAPPAPSSELILTSLLNELTSIPDHFMLVLDDYHLIEAQTVDQALFFLLEHLPPQMHLVITTREDPQLPMSRLRARGQLTELRAADLRFTPSEAAEFLNLMMGLNLSLEDIAVLETRTEGWIAGLQLAALSMQGQQDVSGFIQAFAGDHQYIVDYLVEEVLQRQPEPVRSFLLQTAILERLNGPLCEAVTGQPGAQARLEALQRGNFFVVPLDDRRHWYRYHHLFADVLRMHLTMEQPGQVAVLHRRASEWYGQNGLVADAIRHALAGQDFERAADLVELAVPAMLRNRQEAAPLGWLQALPDDLFLYRPVLSAGYASALLVSGQLAEVDARLPEAERWLDTAADIDEKSEPSAAKIHLAKSRRSSGVPGRKMVVVDEDEFRRLPGAVAVSRAGLALFGGNVPDTVKYARQALDLAADDDHLGRGSAAVLLALTSWSSGDLETAHRMYADGMESVRKAGHISSVIGCAIALADIRIAQGRLHEAMNTYEWGMQLATEHGNPALRGAADMLVGIGELEREHNDLAAAAQQLLRSKQLGELAGLPQNPYRWRVAMARIRQIEGDLDGALNLLDEAEVLYTGDFSPDVRPVAAFKTRVWVAQGRLGEALGWAREQGLSSDDNLSYLREFEHITLARALLARSMSNPTDPISDATGLLDRLLKAAQEGGRIGSVIEILVLQALAQQASGDRLAALLPLQRALTLAEPEGYVRMFLDEGLRMAQVLREAAAQGFMPDYTGKLLAGFEAEQLRSTGEAPLPHLQKPSLPASKPLIEPLSQRELEVLRLFKTELSGPEIAHELMIALSTVRTHTESIYSKLNVKNRRAAVKRAAELGLI